VRTSLTSQGDALDRDEPLKWFRKAHLVVIAVLILGFVGVCIGAAALIASQMCSDYHGTDVSSPDGRFVATVTQSHCGATGPSSLDVVLEDRAQRNRFRFWMHRRITVFEVSSFIDPEQVELRWEDQRRLVIAYPHDEALEITTQQTRWHGVDFVYEPAQLSAIRSLMAQGITHTHSSHRTLTYASAVHRGDACTSAAPVIR
jgi:hypothetical protein